MALANINFMKVILTGYTNLILHEMPVRLNKGEIYDAVFTKENGKATGVNIYSYVEEERVEFPLSFGLFNLLTQPELDGGDIIYSSEYPFVPKIILKGYMYGFKFVILTMGSHPCAYVERPNLPSSKIQELNVHGGITYEGVLPEMECHAIGWDYAHYMDHMEIPFTLFKKGGINHTRYSILEDIRQVLVQVLEMDGIKEDDYLRNSLKVFEK